MDVYPNEPDINLELIDACYLATGHIAGHGALGKYKMQAQIYHQLSKMFSSYTWPSYPKFSANLMQLGQKVH